MRDDPYIAFLLNEAEQIDEEGFLHSAARRAGSRVKNALLATVGGNTFGFGSEAKGQLYTQDIAGKLRRAWFDYAGKMKGKSEAKPTEKNIKNWMKNVYGVSVHVPSDGDAPVDSEEAAASAEEEREAADLSADDELDVAAADEPKAAKPKADQNAETPAQAPARISTVTPSSPEEDEIDTMTDYMMAGMGVKGFKPSEKLLAAQGRSPKQHLSYLRRFMQAAAGPETIDPVSKAKPFPNTTPIGKALAMMTAALEKGPEQKVTMAMDALEKVGENATPAEKDAISQYLAGVMSDTVYTGRYPSMAKDMSSDQTSADAIPFATRFRKVGGMLAVMKSGTKGSKPSVEQANQLGSGLSELIAAAMKGTDAERKQLQDLMEPLETDTTLLNKVPQLRGIIARYKNVQESRSLYAGLVLREAGAEAASPNAPLRRVAFDKLFHDIAQQLIAGGHISHDGADEKPSRSVSSPAARGGVSRTAAASSSAPTDKSTPADQPDKKKAGKTDKEEEEFAVDATEVQQHIDEVSGKLGSPVPRGALNRLIRAGAKKNAREIIATLATINDKRVLGITIAVVELFAELGYDANDFRKSVKHFAMLYRQPIKNTFERYNPIVAAMHNGNRRNLIDAIEDLPRDELRTFCGAMMMEVVNEQ